MKPKVAVVGGGIAGIATAAELKDRFRVVLFEEKDRLGFVGNSRVMDGREVEIPLRMLSLSHHKELAKLYDRHGVQLSPVEVSLDCAGVQIESAQVDQDFQNGWDWDGNISGWGLPVVRGASSRIEFAVRGARLWWWWLTRYPQEDESWGTWWVRLGRPRERFVDLNLCWTLGCRLDDLDAWPARPLLDYCLPSWGSGWMRQLRRPTEGVSRTAERLLDGVEVRYRHRVEKIRGGAMGHPLGRTRVSVSGVRSPQVDIMPSESAEEPFEEHFRYVVVATPSRSVPSMVKLAPEIKRAFLSQQRTYNVCLEPDVLQGPLFQVDQRGVEVSVRVRLEPYYNGGPKLVETWNSRSCSHGSPTFSRPVFRADSRYRELRSFERIQGRDGIFYAGSYVVPGMALQEEAVVSSLRAVRRIERAEEHRTDDRISRLLEGEVIKRAPPLESFVVV